MRDIWTRFVSNKYFEDFCVIWTKKWLRAESVYSWRNLLVGAVLVRSVNGKFPCYLFAQFLPFTKTTRTAREILFDRTIMIFKTKMKPFLQFHLGFSVFLKNVHFPKRVNQILKVKEINFSIFTSQLFKTHSCWQIEV